MKPEILILSPVPPLTTLGGTGRRLCHMIRALAVKFIVRVVVVHNGGTEIPKTLVEGITSCHIIRWKSPSRAECAFNWGMRLLTGNPFGFSRATREEFKTHVCDHYDPDIVIVVKCIMGALLLETDMYRHFQNVPLILDEGALHYLSYQREAQFAEHLAVKGIYYLRYKRLYHFSKMLVPCFDKSTVVSRDEQRLLQNFLSNGKIMFVPNGVEDFQSVESVGRHLLFMGPFHYAPNAHALNWFIKEVYPLIDLSMAGVKLYIAGSHPPAYLANLARSDKNIVVTGHIDNLSDIYGMANVVLCPMWKGAGTRTKVLEAMSFGKAVVATTIGVEGIDARNNEEILIRDTPRGFAEAVQFLLAHPVEVDRIGKNARACVLERYRWISIMDKFCDEMESLILR